MLQQQACEHESRLMVLASIMRKSLENLLDGGFFDSVINRISKRGTEVRLVNKKLRIFWPNLTTSPRQMLFFPGQIWSATCWASGFQLNTFYPVISVFS